MPTTILQSLKIMILFQLGLALGGGLLWTALGHPQQGASFAVGAAVMLINVVLLTWIMWRLLEKKPIAWTIPLIVIKYTILLGSVVYFARTSWFNSLGAGLGVASFVIAALGSALITTKAQAAKIDQIKTKKRFKKERDT